MLKNLLLVGLGGFAGSVARYLLSKLLNSNLPWGTLLVNVGGCFLIGLFYALADNGNLSSQATKLLLTVGFCGGFTTFSTFINENFMMLKAGELLTTLLYICCSVLLGFAAVWFGYWLVRNL